MFFHRPTQRARDSSEPVLDRRLACTVPAATECVATSRVIRVLGVRGALFVLPVIALVNYSIITIAPGFFSDSGRSKR